MSKLEARRAAQKAMLSGYKHHSRSSAQELMDAAMRGRSPALLMQQISLETYADVLAPTRFRAMQNGLICLVTVVSRIAIDHGVENELAFALSDYYVNAVELQNTTAQLNELAAEIIEHYVELVKEEQRRHYSLPVSRAIWYINQHLYDACRVGDVAASVGLNPQYFSTLFKKEVGAAPSRYITEKKLDEAQYLLRQTQMQAAEIAEALGFCSASHFISTFRRHKGITPKQTLRNGG